MFEASRYSMLAWRRIGSDAESISRQLADLLLIMARERVMRLACRFGRGGSRPASLHLQAKQEIIEVHGGVSGWLEPSDWRASAE
jgi:hypothetical protein